VVAASQPLAVTAGMDALAQGGTAVDAAVACAAAQAVVEPMSTGLGGDSFALLGHADADGITGFNGSGAAPSGRTIEALRGLGHTTVPERSPLAVTVPGTVDAYAQLVDRHGRLGFAAALEPARRYADEGFVVSPIVAAGWQRLEPVLRAGGPSGAELLPGGRAPRAGEVVRLPELARTLATLQNEGPRAMYEGPLAVAMTPPLDAVSLGAHRGEWTEPIHLPYRGVVVVEHAPNGQGLAALLALASLSAFDLAAHDPLDPALLHLQIEAMKGGVLDAAAHVADPRHAEVPVAALLARPRPIDPQRASDIAPGSLTTGTDTVYVAAADGEGLGCSLISSLYLGFGTGIVAPGTGVALQCRGAGFSLDPEHPNALAPGKRPFHTIIPGMLCDPVERPTANGPPVGRWRTVFGVMGGPMQPQGHVQVVCAMVDHGLDPQEALDLPRWYVHPDGAVDVEREMPEASVEGLRRLGHRVHVGDTDHGYGGGQIITRDPGSGALVAGSDPRKDGQAAAR
jgi:gamma-glutamyltranspeptidase/glutathione hydrolase